MKRAFAFAPLLVLVIGACAPAPLATSPTSTATATASATPSSSPPASPSATAGPSALALSTIQRLSATVGYAASFNGGGTPLAKTSDGGATWTPVALPGSGYLISLRFIDERVGWAAAFFGRDAPQIGCSQAAPTGTKPCRGVLLRTTDGGATWSEALTVPIIGYEGAPVRALQAVDGDRAWAVTTVIPCGDDCDTADVRRTTDGGRTWRTVFNGRVAAIRFASATRGWVATYGANDTVAVRATSDGGATWSAPFVSGGSGGFIGLDAASADVAWLLTRDGAYCTSSSCQRYELWRTSDGGASWKSLGNPKREACSYGHLTAPLFASAARGWMGLNLGAGGAEGVGGILTTNDGGATWSCATTPPNVALLSAADADHLWVATIRSVPETLRASDDGGNTWRELPLR